MGQHIGREHADIAWRLYAEIYADKMWFGQNNQDKTYVERFTKAVTHDLLHDLFCKYGLIRNFSGSPDLGEFACMLNGYRDQAMAKEQVPGVVEQEVASMKKVYGFEPLSAVTKSFWMMKQHPIVIKDNKAWEGLRRRGLKPGTTYRTYYGAWFKFYDEPETQMGLGDALSWLPGSATAEKIVGRGKADAAEIKNLAESSLMRNRVIDIRLLYEGGSYLEDVEGAS